MELHLSKLFAIIYQNNLKQKIKRQSIFLKKDYFTINNIQKNLFSQSNDTKSNSKEYFITQNIEYYKGIILNKYNISSIKHSFITPFLKDCFNNIQYLSLKYNHIRNLNFIKYFPNLYYLDISNNPLEEIEALNFKNIFGYLKLSFERYSERKILNISGLYCGIFELYLNDESLLTLFKNNNPFIILFNNKINYFYDKVVADEEKDSKNSRRYSFKAFKTVIERNIILDHNFDKEKEEEIKEEDNDSDSDDDNDKEEDNGEDKKNIKTKLIKSVLVKQDNNNLNYSRRRMKRTSSIKLKYNFLNCYNYGFKSGKNMKFIEKIQKKSIENEIKNKGLLKIKTFFDEYNRTIIHICNNCNTRGRKSKIPIKSKYLKNYKEYLLIEKRKLILLNNIYQKLSKFNKEKKENKYYLFNKDNINVNPNVDNLEMLKLKNYIKCIYTNPSIAVIVLIVLLFYCLGIISNLMMNTLMGYLLVKYYKYIDVINIPKFENENTNFHFLCYYYDNYENIRKKFEYSDIKDNKILDIINILDMTKITLKSNELYFNKKKINNFNINNINKKIYIEELNYLESLEIKDEVLSLLLYLCDFIIYDNLEQLLINGGYPNEYSYLIRFKEIIKEREFNLKEKEIALSERKYQKYQVERLYNKFYFKLYKIEEIKNSKFNDMKKNKNQILKIKNEKVQEDEDYSKIEDIQDINKYLIIQNKNNEKMFNNVRIMNSFKTFSPKISFNSYSNFKNNTIKLKLKNNIKNNISNKNNSNNNQKKKSININISQNSNRIINYKDKTKLILKTLNNFKLNNKLKQFKSQKLLLKKKDNNNDNINQLLKDSNNFMFRTFSNDYSIKSNIKSNSSEKNFIIKGYYSNKIRGRRNKINNIEDLFDIINEQNKKVDIRNNDKYNCLRNAERIYSKKKKDLLLLKELNLTNKGLINDNGHLISISNTIAYNSIPSLDIKKYNQKEMEKLILNYKNKKYKNFIKKQSKYA